jgi:chromosome segregation ATPase
MTEEQKLISIEYLIDLISSIKSALSNIDNTNARHNQVLSEISENITILSELNKKQNQDQKIMLLKYDSMVRSLDRLANEIKLSNQQIISSHEKLQSNLEIVSQFKKDNLDGLEKSIESLSQNIRYIKQKTEESSLVQNIQGVKNEGRKKMWDKIIELSKNLNKGVGTVYKVLVLATAVFLIVLWLVGTISWDDIKNIVGSFKIF